MRPAGVAVLVPSWNGREHLEICLAALAEQSDPGCPWQAWVLDNGSTDDTTTWIAAHHPDVRLVESERNLGFAAGMNRLVDECDTEAVALLNNDTRPTRDWLAALVDTLAGAPPDVAAVSGRIIDWEGACLDFGRGVMAFDGHAFQLDFGRPLSEARAPRTGDELLFACGGNMIAWRDVFVAAGGFDPDYFAYFEDVDLGWRLWAEGRRVIAAAEAFVHHRSSGTSQRLGNERRGLLFERNAFLTAYKNFDDATWASVQPAILLTLMSRTQTMLVQNNPGGGIFTEDPFGDAPATELFGEPTLVEKLRGYGPVGSLVRAVRKLGRVLAGTDGAQAGGIAISDPRSVAQLQAVSYLLGNLDRSARKRREVQSRRTRSDEELFERFPLYLVPTYPGDDRLFASEGFRSWLPPGLPLIEASLSDVMAVTDE